MGQQAIGQSLGHGCSLSLMKQDDPGTMTTKRSLPLLTACYGRCITTQLKSYSQTGSFKAILIASRSTSLRRCASFQEATSRWERATPMFVTSVVNHLAILSICLLLASRRCLLRTSYLVSSIRGGSMSLLVTGRSPRLV